MQKRVLSILLAFVLVLSAVPFAIAQGTPTITVSSVEAAAGETVTLGVALANNPGINTFSLGFDYDTSRLRLISVTPDPAIGGQFAFSKKAVWLNSTDSTYSGNYLNLSFEVLSTASLGDARVTVTYAPGDISNYNEDDVDFNVVAGKVSTVSASVNTGTITVGTASGIPGSEVTVPVSISGNPGINTFSLGFDYDTSRLSLKTVTVNPSLGGQFAYSKKAVWLGSSDSIYNGEILTLTFTVLTNAVSGEARVAVTYAPGDISNYNEEDVNFNLVSGKVTVGTIPTSGGTITVGTTIGTPGSQVSVPVSISGNPGINTFSLGFDYDATRLTLTSVSINSSLGGQFTYSKKAVWLNSTDTSYNGEILTLTFSVLQNAALGDASVAVTYNSGDISNYNEEDVNFTLVSGKITIKNSEPITGASVQVLPEKEKVKAGETFSVDLILKDNPGMAGLIVTLQYDSSIMVLKNVSNGNLFDTFSSNTNLIWSSSSGLDIAADGTLATLTFEVAESTIAGKYPLALIMRESVNAAGNDLDVGVQTAEIEVIDFIYGDVNGDGKVSIKDVVLLNQYLANYDYDTGVSAVTVEAGADANGDGKISIKDVVLLNQYLANYDYDTGTSPIVLGPQG